MRTRSVHGIGMRRHLTIAGIDRHGRVAAVRRLQPGRIVVMPRVTWIAELPKGSLPPAVGTRLQLLRSGGGLATS
jgi:hypothetical protein